MQEQIKPMVGTQQLSCIDLKSGFWQVKITQETLQYAAFTMEFTGS